jgi:TatD DNase family protein
MIDAHCHIDQYPNPYQISTDIENAQILTIAVTNTPLAFEKAYPHIRSFRYIRLALGLHPLHADRHEGEKTRFIKYLTKTSYIGEVGLDFSREGISTRDIQISTFRFILEQIQANPKFISIHSRRAEDTVIDMLEEFQIYPAVFHWFSGSLSQLKRLIDLGHYCSVNPAMLLSKQGCAIIERLPPDRVLTETDGPFVSVNNRPAVPADVSKVEIFLSKQWEKTQTEVRQQLRENLRKAIPVQ